MARKLTKKQKGFVKDYLETGNGSLAAKKNYDVTTDESARAVASQNLTKPAVQNALSEAFPDSELFELHREGLYEDDMAIRHKYLDTAYKLKGSYAAEKHINLNLDVESTERTQGLADRLNGLLRR